MQTFQSSSTGLLLLSAILAGCASHKADSAAPSDSDDSGADTDSADDTGSGDDTGVEPSSTLTVAADGTGDYNCDGGSDQVEINEALDLVADSADYTTVYLKGPATYWIDEPIVISSDTVFTGDPDAVVQLVDEAGWPGNKPLISQKGADNWDGNLEEAIYGKADDALSNVEISGFEISGGNQSAPTGRYFVILMIFYNASDLSIHDMYLHDSRGDIIRMMSPYPVMSSHIRIYNNRIEDSGHEGLYLGYVDDVEVYDNEIYGTRTNCGVRIGDSSQITVNGNTIGNSLDTVASGYGGICINSNEHPVESVEIADNTIFGKAAGIVLNAEGAKQPQTDQRDVYIHHNRMFRIYDNTAGGDTYLNGGVHIHGFYDTLIEYNTIDQSEKDGIVYETPEGSPEGVVQTVVRNNIISNSAGYGVNNLSHDTHSFVASHNCVFNNALGDYSDTSSATDTQGDPLFAHATGVDPAAVDLHLQSEFGRWNGTGWVKDAVTSPCIDAGDPSASTADEPAPNGGRVNAGGYGGTVEASKHE